MEKLIAYISLIWIKEDPSCLVCKICNDIIYSNTYRLNFAVNKKVNEAKFEFVVCESCYELVK